MVDVYEYTVYFGINSLVDKLQKFEAVVSKTYIDKIEGFCPTYNKVVDIIIGMCDPKTKSHSVQEHCILILTVPRRYFCCGSLLLLVLAVRIYTSVHLLC